MTRIKGTRPHMRLGLDYDATDELQERLDDGGIVELPEGRFKTSAPLRPPSDTIIAGAGRGRTIIEPSSSFTAYLMGNSLSADAVIAGIGVENVHVRDLTVDMQTNGARPNGIAFYPGTHASGFGSGTPCENVSVEQCEVLVVSDSSHYGIWNFRAKHAKYVNNWVIGDEAVTAGSEGIEVAGGYDVLVAGNTVRLIGGNGIYLNTAGGTANTRKQYVRVVDNFVEQCERNIRLIFAAADSDGEYIIIANNQLVDSRREGLDLDVQFASTIPGPHIHHNHIKGGDFGIRIQGDSGGIEITDGLIDHNYCEGQSNSAIYMDYAPDWSLLDNLIRNPTQHGIILANCGTTRNVVNDNIITGEGGSKISLQGGSTILTDSTANGYF